MTTAIKQHQCRGYATDNELLFLRRLGTDGRTILDADAKRRHVMLLHLYLQAMDKRVDWGDIDKARVRRFVVSSLKGAAR